MRHLESYNLATLHLKPLPHLDVRTIIHGVCKILQFLRQHQPNLSHHYYYRRTASDRFEVPRTTFTLVLVFVCLRSLCF